MLPFVALAMEDRGKHAWGASNGLESVHHLGPIHETWGTEIERFSGWTAGIWHTRAASVGASNDPANIHPFTQVADDGRTIIGIHNGGISNHLELNTRYSRQCKVDSEHLWLHRARGLPWTELRGYANVAWWERDAEVMGTPPPDPKLYLARINSTCLYVAKVTDGGLIFASTLTSLQLAAAMTGTKLECVYNTDEYRVHRLAADTLWLCEEEVRFGTVVTVSAEDAARGRGASGNAGGTSYTGNFSHVHSGPSGPGRVYCFKCHVCLSEQTHFICQTCERYLLEDFAKWKGTQRPALTEADKSVVDFILPLTHLEMVVAHIEASRLSEAGTTDEDDLEAQFAGAGY